MKILLIDPPYERFIGFRSEWFPLGISSIASYMAAQGHDVAIYHAEHGQETQYKSLSGYAESFNKYKAAIESDNHPIWEEVRQQIISFRPRVVGISVITPKVPSALKIAEICKKIDSDIKVILGNHHPTIHPEEMLANVNVDFIVRGEGEEIFGCLANSIDSSAYDYSIIKGLSFRKNGMIINNPDHTPISNLDTLPFPARDRLLRLETYSPTQLSMVMTSRGCPYKCGFCASRNMWGKKVRFRSVENIIAELREIKEKYGVRNVTFMDDSFTINSGRVEDFCAALIESRLDITWSCLTRVNMMNDKIIKMMKKAGCTKVDIGIESGNQRILELIDKGIKLEQVRKAVEILKRNRMFWSGFFMFGFPTETEEEICDTVNFMKELKPNWANISIFTPYPGTALYDLAIEKGMISSIPDYTSYSHQNPAERFTDQIPQERFCYLADKVLAEVHKHNSSSRSLITRAMTRNYHKNPGLLFQDAKKIITWLRK